MPLPRGAGDGGGIVTRPQVEGSELADIVALLVAVGRPEPEPVAPLLVSYHQALARWRDLAHTVVDAHTWPAHSVEPVTRSDRR
jgi:hypothetical protein